MFCGARPLTKTHLIAQRAIRQHLPPATGGVIKYASWRDQSEQLQHRQHVYDLDPLSQQVKRACEPCNRDWMGAIENDVAQTVVSLARGQAVEVDPEMAARVALWASVVAALRAAQDPGGSIIALTDAEHMRSRDCPPDGYTVWLIRGETRWDFTTRHQQILVTHDGEPSQAGHLTWFWLGQAVFMVAHPSLTWAMDRLGLFGDAVQLLYAEHGFAVAWPARSQVTNESMLELTTTFFGQ